MASSKSLDPNIKKQVKQIAQKVVSSSSIVFFTGAGMSTESGIPDYRSQGGLWDRFTPVYFDEFMSSRDARVRYWNQRLDMEKSLKHARPNKGHMAIARLERLGLLTAVITQNIDGLHHESGISPDRIIELHGNTRQVRCMSCRELTPWETVLSMIKNGDHAPNCTCGGFLKPDTVSFGQAMPEEAVRRATQLSAGADLFIAVGSTLLVQPAASMPDFARSAGAFTVVINLSGTPFDSKASMVIQQKAGPMLAALADQVEKQF